MPRYRLDATVRRFGTTIVGGSPLKLFRLTDRGGTVFDRIAAGDDVADSRLTDSFLDAGVMHPAITGRPSRLTEADVTVVVPTFDRPAHLPPGAILVDDGSEPPIAGAAIRLDHNRGPAAARNAGLAVVGTTLVAFVDTDVALPPGWLAGLLPHFDDDRVALVAPRVRSRPTGGAIGRWEREHSPLDLGPDPARVRAGTRVSYVPAAAIVCRTDALRAIGGFDETMRFGEDVDLVWRLDAAGWWCRYEPAVEVEHDPRPDWPAWLRQRAAYGSSAAPLARRHPRALAPVRTSGWSVLVWSLGVVGHPFLAAAAGIGTAVALVRKLADVPARTAFGLAAMGNARAGEQLATAVRRAWWPLVAVAAVRSPASRRMLVAAAIAARHPMRLLDDVAYSIGLWRGVASDRTLAPLVPELVSWPGRSTPPAAGSEQLPSSA